jgi:hypothetical protein
MRLIFKMALVAQIVVGLSAYSADEGFAAEKTDRGVTVKYKGELFTEYVIKEANKPYLWPVIGPMGKPMTRAYPMKTIDGEQHDHPHHRSIYFGHEVINGSDTWHEAATFVTLTPKRAEKLGAVVHREFLEVKADADKAVIVAASDYNGPDGKKTMEEIRRMTFRVDGETRVIDFDIEFIASAGPVTFEDRKDAGFSVRVPTSMAVDSKQGGRIITSEGLTDAAAWGKRGKWCDYYGPVDGETLGIAMLNHPSSFNHPTPWHVRTYGLLTANAFGVKSLDKTAATDGKKELKAGERLVLRHRIIFHKGDEKAGGIAAAYEKYAKETFGTDKPK